MITLLEAHFEIVRPLIRLVLLNLLPIDDCATWLAQAALILTHVVQLRTAHREVRLGVAIAFEDLPRELLVQFNIGDLLLSLIRAAAEGLLRRCFRHFEILLRQVRLA